MFFVFMLLHGIAFNVMALHSIGLFPMVLIVLSVIAWHCVLLNGIVCYWMVVHRHHYIKLQFLVLGGDFFLWKDYICFLFIQAFSSVLPWNWQWFKTANLIFVGFYGIFCTFLQPKWVDFQPCSWKSNHCPIQWSAPPLNLLVHHNLKNVHNLPNNLNYH